MATGRALGAQYLHEWDAPAIRLLRIANIDTDLLSIQDASVCARANHDIYFAATMCHQEDAFLSGGFFAPYGYGIYDHTPLEAMPLVSAVTTTNPATLFALRYAISETWLTYLA
ncbi:hypothetical protein O3W44_24635 [Pantoea sp. LMR881]|uniref:hypothetical protein n=1 Tax=Pantoea sp. LMR881 TaxID=3014336 RepID=UPI0022AFEED1|nr:hypothetical protein [Pantoea sp. LMR881]MCZ4061638.1 hypothetical protein [Pantoea sp. LMR881]